MKYQKGWQKLNRVLKCALAGALVFAFAGCAAPVDGEEDEPFADGLSIGADGDDIATLHTLLTAQGYFPNAELGERFPDWVPAVAEAPEQADVFDERTEEAVALFQRTHGLEPTGVVDDTTWDLVGAPRCGNPVYEHGAEDDKWHHDAQWSSPWTRGGTFTYRVVIPSIPPAGMTAAQFRSAVRTAFNAWEREIDVRFVFTTSSSSDAVITFRFIDGPGGVGGITYNNFWGGNRHSIEIDSGENFVVGGNPNAEIVLAHEIGHMLGFNHSSVPGSLMLPTGPPSLGGPIVFSDDDLAATTFRYRDWELQPGRAFDIGFGDTGAWVIGRNGTGGGFGIHRFNGVSWVPVNGGAWRISVGNVPWVVNITGRIFERQGVTIWNRAGTHWADRSAGFSARDIGVASGQRPWIITNEARGSGGTAIRRFNGTTWVEVGGAATRVAVGADGTVYVVNAAGRVFRRLGITGSNPSGTSWLVEGNLAPNIFGNETGVATDVSVSRSGIAWVTGRADGNRTLFVRQAQTAIPGRADAFARWVTVPGSADNIAVVNAHDPWITSPGGFIRRRTD